MDTILSDNGIPDVDFLLPHCDADVVNFPLTPMTYATALFHFRRLIHCPWRSSSNPMTGLDLNFTLHSLKATNFWPPTFHAHATRAEITARTSCLSILISGVYSRDNVWGALDFQRQIIMQVRLGWRPQVAQHRGSQRPLQEPQVTLEFFPNNSQTIGLPGYIWRLNWTPLGYVS